MINTILNNRECNTVYYSTTAGKIYIMATMNIPLWKRTIKSPFSHPICNFPNPSMVMIHLHEYTVLSLLQSAMAGLDGVSFKAMTNLFTIVEYI